MTDPAYLQLSRESILACLAPNALGWMRELRVHREIDSTSSHLVTRAAMENIDGVVCIAEHQTSGRGRRGRTWLTPPEGSIALSLGRELSLAVAEIPPLSLIVGVAVAKAINRFNLCGVSLKWPNDVLLDGAKVGGILIEIVRTTCPVVVVIGVGINIGSGAEVGARLGVAVGDIVGQGQHVSRNELIAEVISDVHDLTSRFESQGFSGMRSDWERLHFHQNRPVQVIGMNETVEGVARGVTASGELVLETSLGIRHFTVGEVSLRAELGAG